MLEVWKKPIEIAAGKLLVFVKGAWSRIIGTVKRKVDVVFILLMPHLQYFICCFGMKEMIFKKFTQFMKTP